MIVASPLSLPKFEPSDWDRWWSIWNEYAKPLVKVRGNHNTLSGRHIGFDIFKDPKLLTDYAAPLIDMKGMWEEFYDELIGIFPFKIYLARFVMSDGDFPAHSDNSFPSWQIRSFFYHPDDRPQWYFTPMNNDERTFLTMPNDTNWFAYLDGECKHGTIFVPEKPKILIQIFANPISCKSFVLRQLGKYPQHEISY